MESDREHEFEAKKREMDFERVERDLQNGEHSDILKRYGEASAVKHEAEH